ncbi:MAG: hypothetical protein RLO52_37625 [Sandaracinaceae bacterium]|nr:MAG: hypothetical protein EVA89_21880 [Sandaracinaceae bacterium]
MSEPKDPHEHPAEAAESLWWLTVGPLAWIAHFLASYLTVSLWCAKVTDRDGALGDARLLIAGYTVVALTVIAGVAWRGYRRHRFGDQPRPHDFDTPGDRHRFLGFSTFLLSAVSAVATVFVSLAVVFIGSCR